MNISALQMRASIILHERSLENGNGLRSTLPDFQFTSLSQLHFVDRQYGWLLDSSGI
jgi:hypothetical protein